MPTVSSFLGRENSALVETDFVGGVKLPIPDDALVQNVLPSLACFTCANSLVRVGICTFYQLVSMSKKGREGGGHVPHSTVSPQPQEQPFRICTGMLLWC